jgi:hypothetical protein
VRGGGVTTEPAGYDFVDALNGAIRGEKWYRSDWPYGRHIWCHHHGQIMMTFLSEAKAPYELTREDFKGTDWRRFVDSST